MALTERQKAILGAQTNNLPTLTPEEYRAWEHAWAYYYDEHTNEEHTRSLAWSDVVAEFPRLQKHNKVRTPDGQILRIPTLASGKWTYPR